MKLSITRKKNTESISVENNRVNEIRKETQLDVNLELSDIPKSLVDFIKKHLFEWKGIVKPSYIRCPTSNIFLIAQVVA